MKNEREKKVHSGKSRIRKKKEMKREKQRTELSKKDRVKENKEIEGRHEELILE